MSRKGSELDLCPRYEHTDELVAGSLLDLVASLDGSGKVDIVDEGVPDQSLRVGMRHMDALVVIRRTRKKRKEER